MQIKPWALKTPEIKLDLADIPKKNKASHDYKINFIELKNSTHYHKIYTDTLKSKEKVRYIIITENNDYN